MDHDLIDRLALALTHPIARGSRRRAVRLLTAAVVGGVLPALALEEVAAKKQARGHTHHGLDAAKKRKKKHHHGGGGAAGGWGWCMHPRLHQLGLWAGAGRMPGLAGQ